MATQFLILREDVFRAPGATLTATFSEEDDYPESRLRDELDREPWMPDSATGGTEDYAVDLGSGNDILADYLILTGHNFGSEGVTLAAQYGSWTTALTFSPSDDADVMIPLSSPPGSAQQTWRAHLTGVTADTEASEILLGRAIFFPFRNEPGSFDPDADVRATPGSARIGRGAAVKFPANYRKRILDCDFSALPDSFLEADSNLSDYAYWERESARRGEPFGVKWAEGGPSPIGDDFLFGVMPQRPVKRRLTPLRESGGAYLAGHCSLSFRVEGPRR